MALDVIQGGSDPARMALGAAAVSANPVTLAGWVKHAHYTGTRKYLLGITNGNAREGWFIGICSGSEGNLVVGLQNHFIFSGQSFSGSAFPDNAWCHVAYVSTNDATGLLYLNGVAGTARDFNPGTPSGLTDTVFFTTLNSGSFFTEYDGCTAKWGIFPSALSPSNIASLVAGNSIASLGGAALDTPFLSAATRTVNNAGAALTSTNGDGSFADCSTAPPNPIVQNPYSRIIGLGPMQRVLSPIVAPAVASSYLGSFVDPYLGTYV